MGNVSICTDSSSTQYLVSFTLSFAPVEQHLFDGRRIAFYLWSTVCKHNNAIVDITHSIPSTVLPLVGQFEYRPPPLYQIHPTLYRVTTALVAWHSGRTSVYDWRTFPVLRSTCARPAADGWPLMWVNRPLQVSQLGQLSLSSFLGR